MKGKKAKKEIKKEKSDKTKKKVLTEYQKEKSSKQDKGLNIKN